MYCEWETLEISASVVKGSASYGFFSCSRIDQTEMKKDRCAKGSGRHFDHVVTFIGLENDATSSFSS